MSTDLNLKILESYVEIDKIQDEINNKMFNFITNANQLVELSEDDYQIEKTIKLNKISLKSYILDSPCCSSLQENNITNYSIEELKNFFVKYEKIYNEDLSKYYLALSLYEMLEEIEKLVDNKIEREISEISNIFNGIRNIKNIISSEYEKLYFDSKNKIDTEYKNNKINDKAHNLCIQLLNDIFNFYMNGYPNIPDEYLYKE